MLLELLLAFLLSGVLQALLFVRREGTLLFVPPQATHASVPAFLVLPELRTLYWRIVVPLLRPDPAMRARSPVRLRRPR